MEEGTKSKKTIFVGGLGDDVDESVIYETFSIFGENQSVCEFVLL
jgi:peptidyl-prolyl isomerase E (cyclophilin E)